MSSENTKGLVRFRGELLKVDRGPCRLSSRALVRVVVDDLKGAYEVGIKRIEECSVFPKVSVLDINMETVNGSSYVQSTRGKVLVCPVLRLPYGKVIYGCQASCGDGEFLSCHVGYHGDGPIVKPLDLFIEERWGDPTSCGSAFSFRLFFPLAPK